MLTLNAYEIQNMRPILIVLTSIFPLLMISAKISLVGNLHDYPEEIITVVKFKDFINHSQIKLWESKTDLYGNFDIVLEDYDSRLKIFVGHISTTFYATAGGEYHFSEVDGELILVNESDSEINRLLTEANSFCVKIESLYRNKRKSKIWEAINELRRYDSDHYMPELINDLIKGRLLITEQRLLQKFGLQPDDDVLSELDRFYVETGHLINSNFLVEAFYEYIYFRFNSRWRRIEATDTSILADLMKEVEFYKDTDVYDLAKVLAVKLAYNGQWYTDREVIRDEALNVASTMEDPKLKSALLDLIMRKNAYDVGEPFPTRSIFNLRGDSTTIYDFDSDFIVVDFWATWCVECIKEMKSFPDLMERFRGRLEIISVSVDDNVEKVDEFLSKKDYKWHFLFDKKGLNLASELGIAMYPTYYILDKKKNIISASTYNYDLRKELDRILK